MCPLIFIKFLLLTKWYPFKNYEKCFSFHLKSFFRSRDIQIVVFLSSRLFLSVSHCFRDWSKINLKVYDIINCLSKKFIRHFVWYLEKEKRYDIETLSIDRVLRTFLWKSHAENVHQKLVLDPFLMLVNNPKQPLHGINSFKNKMFWKKIIKKS